MSIEAMKQALEALEYPLNTSHEGFDVDMAELLAHRAITSLRQAIAEASENGLYREGYRNGYGFGEAAGKQNAKREWVGLTDDELPVLAQDSEKVMSLEQTRLFYKRIEAKLKEKNT